MDLYRCQSNQVTSVYDDVSADRSSSMNSELYRVQTKSDNTSQCKWIMTKSYCRSNPRVSHGKEMRYSLIDKSVT